LSSEGIAIITGAFSWPRVSHAGDGGTRRGDVPGADRIIAVIRDARTGLELLAAEADPIATAVLRLAPGWAESALPALGAAVVAGAAAQLDPEGRAGDHEGDPLVGAFCDAAVAEIQAGRIEPAAALFATLWQRKSATADALIGLAICGTHLGKFEEALVFANECMKLPEKPPRAFCIAGFCELQLGNRKSAQSLLALAARMARRRPEFRDDLRAAQRLLLILHYA
jgi:hypothetical protein